MTTDMFNAFDVLGSWFGGFASGAGLAAIVYILRRQGLLDLAIQAATDRAAAEKVRAENERARWAPAYSENTGALPAVEHVTGEVVAVAETPALSAESHEDEQATDEDDDHAGMWWLPLMTLPLLLARAFGYALGWVQRGGRWLLDSLLVGVAMVASALGKVRKPKAPVYAGRHWVADVQHTGQFPTIPAQHDGEVSA